MFQTKTQPHCGHCSQCIDRRFAILASGLQGHDPAKGYASDVFLGPRQDPLERAIAVDYVRHGLELARKSENELAASFNTELSRAVRHVKGRSEAACKIIAMHKRHGEVVSRVLEQQLRANAGEFVDGTLDSTSLLAMVATRKHLPTNDQSLAWATDEAMLKGEGKPSASDQVSVAILRVEASLQHLHSKKGMKYCSFLKDCGVKPKWSEPCPSNYCAGYQAGNPWRKKIQDEKTRAKTQMEGYTDPALADAFNFYLPDKLEELSGLLNSRNSRPASKTSVSPAAS